MSYRERIKEAYAGLRISEKKVADYILEHSSEIPLMALGRLAKNSGVSEPTVVRFIKATGYPSYSQFKIDIAIHNKSTARGRDIHNYIHPRDNEHYDVQNEPGLLVDFSIDAGLKPCDIPANTIGMTIRALKDTLNLLDVEQYQQAIRFITEARTIDLYGVGNSGSIANDMANKLLRIGLDCRMYFDNHLQQICARHLDSGDLAIAFSHSGNTIDTVNALKLAREAGARTIAITNYGESVITDYADICFITGDILESSYYSERMFSRISQLAFVDMLYTGVLLSDYDKYSKRLDSINKLVSEKVF